ncbi:hypothetical protein B7764_06680 [Pantoea ananatis]|uniref:hypothetical protein n=1 Tax=Pantoea ananas TaxID=553 RepID=UPI000B5F2954|nr:hypothetical protein [Pantoea ananatis]ASN14888.1 hypothetical protein B7764_06680 [Pantoea ananatis]
MLDFFKDIFSAFRQSSLERIKSPFLGAFVFSWIGFNWQMLSILFLSKQNILGRLDYINTHFDVGNYILGPISTTFIICLLLPSANKFVTKFQKGTNHETNMLILQSKIDIASKQVEIADYEAKKKLAEEREKKNIDANIHAILKENIDSREEIKSQNEKISLNNTLIRDLNNEVDNLKKDMNASKSSSETHAGMHLKSLKTIAHLKAEIEKNKSEKLELNQLKEKNEELTEKLMAISSALNSREKEVLKLESELTNIKNSLAILSPSSRLGLGPLNEADMAWPKSMVEALTSSSPGLKDAAKKTNSKDHN